MKLITEEVTNIGDFKDVEVIEVLVSEGQSIKKHNSPLILRRYIELGQE